MVLFSSLMSSFMDLREDAPIGRLSFVMEGIGGSGGLLSYEVAWLVLMEEKKWWRWLRRVRYRGFWEMLPGAVGRWLLLIGWDLFGI
jgi:hypothetical protein